MSSVKEFAKCVICRCQVFVDKGKLVEHWGRDYTGDPRSILEPCKGSGRPALKLVAEEKKP